MSLKMMAVPFVNCIFPPISYFKLTIAIVSMFLCFIVINWLKRPRTHLPPGPWRLPILGYYPFMTKTPHLKFAKLAKKYGEIMSLNLMGKTVIHLNSYEAIREAYLKRGDDFSGRPQDFSPLQWILEGKAIVQLEGPIWKEHRRFALHTLRDFGFGKLTLEERILDIAKDLLDVLQESKGRPQDVSELLSAATANVIYSLMFDRHYNLKDQEFVELLRQLSIIMRSLPGIDAFIAGPVTCCIPFRYTQKYAVLKTVKQNFFFHLENVIQEHEDSLDETRPRDYTDVYLLEAKKFRERGQKEDSTFTKDRLKAIALNLFIAGTETSSTTLNWALKLLMVHGDIQEKIQKELDYVIGRDRLPSWADHSKLPYTEAAIMEVLRFATIVPFIRFHSNPEPATLMGYSIPKRSIIMANLWSAFRDPHHWSHPDIFDPSRFLNEEGKVIRKDAYIPFSIGKRACLGESLAKMEIFLLLTAILHQFNITAPSNERDLSMGCYSSITRTANSYLLCAIPR